MHFIFVCAGYNNNKLFNNYLLLEKGGTLHLCKIKPPFSKMLVSKFVKNWPRDSGKEDLIF